MEKSSVKEELKIKDELCGDDNMGNIERVEFEPDIMGSMENIQTNTQCKGKYVLRQHKKKSDKEDHIEESFCEEDQNFACPRCPKVYDSKTGLLNHMRTHQVTKGFTCALCKAMFKTNKELIEHKTVHKGDKRLFICKQCKVAYSDHCDYLIHDLEHTQRSLFKCEECHEYFKHKSRFKSHILVHYDKELACDECDIKFKSTRSLESHLKNSHFNKKQCGECGKLCNQWSYKYHMNSHTGVKPFQCLYCGKGFATTGQRQVHTRTHTDERPYHCNICNLRFRQRTDRNRHAETHVAEKLYQCDYCKKKFLRKVSIIAHVRTHMDYRPYQCPECEVRCTTLQNLRRHIILEHTTEQPYECKVCDVKYKFQLNLQKHNRSRRHKNMMYGVERSKSVV